MHWAILSGMMLAVVYEETQEFLILLPAQMCCHGNTMF